MKSTTASASPPVFDLKGSVLTVMVLQLRQTDPARLIGQLEEKIASARAFFRHAPVLIELKEMDEPAQLELDFAALAATLRELGLVPVGVRGQAEAVEAAALSAGLALLPAVKTEKSVPAPECSGAAEAADREERPTPTRAATEPAPPSLKTPTLVIAHPVRSGQQVIAPEGDLVVLSSVNAGAEVLAAGNIHIYGALRGRALAGIGGNDQARIFSLQCNPELVAIAGEYVVNERLKKSVINQSVQISLREGRLRFEVLGTFSPHERLSTL